MDIFIQSNIFEESRNQLREALIASLISVDNKDLKYRESEECFYASTDYDGEDMDFESILEKAISLHERDRLETFELFSNDKITEVRFSFTK